jgi:hypothetical protein
MKKKSWREDCKENGCLVGGMATITYELDGKQKAEKVKFVGKFWHIDQLDRTDEDPYFKGVVFDMYNNHQGSVVWNKKEFLTNCKFFEELF